ncbi:MAG: multicopper oxidase domain-containing protein [Acidobacteriota bacterium]|nr:multicopper oxidase domain-containing protein [Acidobacteriota bacterium]
MCLPFSFRLATRTRSRTRRSIEPKQETLVYDREYVVMIDDWLDGSPADAYAKLKRGEMQGGHVMPGMSGGEMGEMKGVQTEGASGSGKEGAGSPAVQMEEGADVAYDTFLINGRAPEAAPEFETKRGERVRLRLINPSGSTMFRVAIGGHKMTVTHADGLAVRPVEVDALEISMGERYDVIVSADNPGVWGSSPSPRMSRSAARALLRYADARGTRVPPPNIIPEELKGRLLRYDQLVALEESSAQSSREPDRRIEMTLGGQMLPYEWKINGKLYPDAEPFGVRAGERVRVSMVNDSLMRHPMHLHGHSFRLLTGNTKGAPLLKDTAFIEPNKGMLEFEFIADNPGDWLFHCHHAYHMEAGMARVFKYV